MKQFTKYICVFLMLMGMSVNAWGTMYIEYGGNNYSPGDVIPVTFDQSEYDYNYVLDNITLTLKNSSPGWTAASGSGYTYGYMQYECNTYDEDWYFFISDDDNSYKNSNQYGSQSVIVGFGSSVAGTFDGTLTINENDYYNGTALQSGTFTIRVTVTAACTQLGTASSLAVDTRYVNSGTTYVKLSWTRGTNVADHATYQKFCYWPKDGDKTCTSTLATSKTNGGITRSSLSTGQYGWSIQALGDGSSYCDSDEAEGEFCIDDVDQATPGSWTGSTLSLTSKRIGWASISNAEYYIVNIINKSTSATIGATDRVINTNSIDITGLTANVTYTISVVAYNACDDASETGSADFSITAYTVSFNLNGEGSNAPSNQQVVKNGKASTPSAPTPPTGKHFDGWYREAGCTNAWNFSTDVVSKDTTLYAKWVVNNYTISFNSNGGSGSMSSVEKAYNSSYSLPSCTFTPPSGKVFDHWGAGSAGGTSYDVDDSYTVTGDITFYAVWKDGTPTDLVFSCAELTLTPVLVTASTPIFITSAANKTVRSQDYIEITGNGLTPSTALTFPGLPSKFAIKNADGTAVTTDVNGEISANAYIFYTPDAGDTSDGLDKLTGITVSVGGAKPKTVNLTQDIIGRHLPADFVIAGKKDGKWYALPADFSEESTPAPIEIAVDDINNPGIAYTANTNIYNLYGQNSGVGYLYNDGDSDGNPDGEKIKLGMKNNGNKPLFAFASPSNALKGDGTATVTNNIGKQYWWTLKQTNTSIDNPQDAKYTITSSNNPGTLSIKNSPFAWGTYKSGVEELRLIPASSVVPTEAEIVAWGKNEAIIEVDQPTIGATSVIGKLPGDIASSKITLSQTGTSKGTGTRFDYTVDFGDDVDFSANEGKMLTLEWYNALDQLVAVSNVTVPRIVAKNDTINSSKYGTKSVWNTEVHVLPGDTLTIDASGYSTKNKDVTIKELNIYPGAAVIINKDTLKVTNLVLRSGWSRIGEKSYGVGSLYIKPGTGYGSVKATNAYMDWYIDYDQYYPIAVPWNVTTANISYQNMTVATSAGLIVRHYDGERHAKGGDGNTNWKAYTWGVDMPATLTPGIGYAITARRPAGKAFSIIRMPLTISSAAWTKDGEQGEVSETHKDQVLATAWVKDEGETPDHAKGWNFIANPYMCTYQGAITHSTDAKYNIKFVNIPDVDFKEFDQVTTATAKLKPGSGFLIQTEETGTLTFGTTNRKASMPSYFAEVPQVLDQQAYILLNGNGAVDQMGLFISDIYTAEYEINADLEKLLSDGNTLRTYMRYGDLNMAYVAINAELAQEWIPVTVRVPASNQYTFSLHEASVVGEMEGIYLIDYESNTITNLIENNYSFVAAGGTVEGRFAINAIAGQHETPTDIDIIQGGGDIHSDKPVKFLYHDKVFIYHRGVIYDATGKKVKVINK